MGPGQPSDGDPAHRASIEEQDEDLSAARSLPAWVPVVAVLVVVLLGVVGVIVKLGDHGRPKAVATTPSTALAASSSGSVPTSSAEGEVTAAPAPELLALGSVSRVGLDPVGFNFEAEVVNQSGRALTIAYPITVLGPAHAPVSLALVGVYATTDVPPYLAALQRGRAEAPTRLTGIRPGETADLVIRVRVACSTAPALERYPAGEPIIRVGLGGPAATFALETGTTSFADMVRLACNPR